MSVSGIVSPTAFHSDNGSHHPARAIQASISKTADRVLGVHGFVIWH
jgi:transposase InsO family protein